MYVRSYVRTGGGCGGARTCMHVPTFVLEAASGGHEHVIVFELGRFVS